MGGPLRHCLAFLGGKSTVPGLVRDELSQLRQLLRYHEFVVSHSMKIDCHVTAMHAFILASVECGLFRIV